MGNDSQMNLAAIEEAIGHLRHARELLKEGGASPRCVNRVRAALKSAEGAERHAWAKDSRSLILGDFRERA